MILVLIMMRLQLMIYWTFTITKQKLLMLMDMTLCFFSFSIKPSKCTDICRNINNPCAKLCVPDVVKNLNVKELSLVSGTNETRPIERHEACKFKCRFELSVCNNKQRWNDNKCKCECKELIDKGVCNKIFIWNSSNCECECYKSCDFSEYLDYKIFEFKKG